MKKVIVFGGSGFLGSYVADELSERGYKVIIADINKSKYIQGNQQFEKVDITKLNDIIRVINDEVDVVYNFAGLTDIDKGFKKPLDAIELNIKGNTNILEVCKENKIDRFIYASSTYAFSDKGSFYGISKFSSEKIVEEYYQRYGLQYTIIRYGSLYGDRADHHNGVYRLLRQAIEKKHIKHKGNGNEVREYIHAQDAARLSVNILDDKKYENEHIVLTGMERLRQKDLITMVKEMLNDKIKVEYSSDERKGHYLVTPYSFNPRIAKKLVANPYIDMGQGLVDCLRTIHEELKLNE